MGRRLLTAAFVAASLVVAGCTIQQDESSRIIPNEQRGQFGLQPTGDVAAGSNRIFLLAPASGDEQPRLRSALRGVPNDPEEIVKSLFAGPNADEQERGLSSALPDDLELLDARVLRRDLTVDVTDAFDQLTPDALRLAVAQLVATANEIEGVENLRLRIDGENQLWPLGDGENTDRVLTIYDYPGLIESSQPAYPGVPTANL